MKERCLFVSAAMFGVLVAANASAQDSLNAMIDRELPNLLATYKMLHAAPELSHHEAKTSAFLAKELKSLGYEVTDRIGKYENPKLTAYGVVAVLRNGSGPTVLVPAPSSMRCRSKRRPACPMRVR